MLRRMSAMASTPHRIRTAAALIIGDEVLNGKIKDTNSVAFARFCFEMGIDLRRVIVVPDDEADIKCTLMSLRKYDLVVTTGGIGPTHDDITYESIAHAYDLTLAEDAETVGRMDLYANKKPKTRQGEALKAQLRMATFPSGPLVKRYFTMQNSWVPVVSIEDRVYIFPGIPSLFSKMLEGLRPHIAARVDQLPKQRRYVSTETAESDMAAALSTIHEKYSSHGIKIGSYPHHHLRKATVSIIGPDEPQLLDEVTKEVEELVHGKEISPEEEAAAW